MHLYAISVFTDPMHHLTNHWDDMLTSVALMAAVSHAVQSFPVPANKYGQWFLGTIQFIVGQRVRAANTLQGTETQK